MSTPEDEAAAQLLKRLLSDPDYRAAFRADPVSASRSAGLEGVAREMASEPGKALQTLDGRESRSSLAGVLMAAALEGAAIVDFSQQVAPHLEEVPRAVGDVLAGMNVGLPGVEDAQAATPQSAAVAPVAGEFPAVSARGAGAGGGGSGLDASQFGQGGHGGPPVPGTEELLSNKRVSLDATGIADLKGGKIDPRIVAVLQQVSRNHTITESAMASDHDMNTTSGSVSNHYYGRAVDIAVVDGQPVGPGNSAARRLAEALVKLPANIRPTEIGSPWALPGAAYFTDGAHQNHIHIAFDDALPSGWTEPAGLGNGAAQPLGPGDEQELPAVRLPAEVPAVDEGDDADEEADEPGGLEDPGGDTDAEADDESDGDGGDGDDADDNDSISDDPSDEEEDDEESDDGDDGEDAGFDGDHDDSSDSDSDDSDDSDGGEDDGDDSDDSESGSDSGSELDSGDGDGASSGDGGSGPSPLDLGDASGAYPGDNASEAQIAAWMGAQAQKRGLPPELPVMASLVESHLRNLNYGDADSVGFFQMRLSVWNRGDYAGYGNKADLQLKWFLDQAAAVKRQRIAAGESVNDPNSYGDWVADIERPAAQYRGRYQLQLGEARQLLRQAGGRSGAGSGPRVEEVADAAGAGGGTAGPRATEAVAEARKYLGTPYHWGGSTPQTGFDCSGLVQWAYAKVGIQIPRTSETQILASNGTPVARNALEPGDLVFFRDSSGDVHHVGMSLGGDRFIEAPHTGDVVKIASLKEPYFAQQYTGARRFDRSGGGAMRAAAAAVAADGGSASPAAGAAGAGGAAEIPAVDPAAVKSAQEALLRDAAQAQQPGTLLFEAVRAQEAGWLADLPKA